MVQPCPAHPSSLHASPPRLPTRGKEVPHHGANQVERHGHAPHLQAVERRQPESATAASSGCSLAKRMPAAHRRLLAGPLASSRQQQGQPAPSRASLARPAGALRPLRPGPCLLPRAVLQDEAGGGGAQHARQHARRVAQPQQHAGVAGPNVGVVGVEATLRVGVGVGGSAEHCGSCPSGLANLACQLATNERPVGCCPSTL